jgi:hypothetical protein
MARKHIVAKYAREGSPGAKIRDDEGGKEGLGNSKGQLLHWRVNVGEGAERFAVVGVVPRGSDVLVLFGDCPYDRRYTWESPLQQLIESIKLSE